WNLCSRVMTLSIVLVGWIFFRMPSWHGAVEYFSRMVTWNHEGVRFVSPYIAPALAAVIVAHLLVHKDRNWAHEIPLRPVILRVGAYAAAALLLSLFGATDAAPFIYFQF